MIGTRELAELLNVSYRTVVHQWRNWGLPGIKIGHSVKFRERDIDAGCANGKRRHGPAGAEQSRTRGRTAPPRARSLLLGMRVLRHHRSARH